MNGRQYQILMAPSAHRRYKKFDLPLQQKIQQEALRIAKKPHRYEELKGPLKGIRSCHFEYKKVQY